MVNKPFRPRVIAHRGGKFWEGEDFSYVSESIRDGADIIELDVRVQQGRYIVQHGPWAKFQGHLEKVLPRLERADLYLDIKDHRMDINRLVESIRSKCANHLIIGSFSQTLLRSITDPSIERNYHWPWPWFHSAPARYAMADWVNPMSSVVTKGLATSIQGAGFKFVPGGNYLFKMYERMGRQLTFAEFGAYAISTHHVKEMIGLLADRSNAVRAHQQTGSVGLQEDQQL
jgi:hypothetical protein